MRQVLPVLVCDLQLDAVLPEAAQQVPGILTAAVDVAESVGIVGGVRGQRVDRHRQDHAPHLGGGHDLPGQPGGPR